MYILFLSSVFGTGSFSLPTTLPFATTCLSTFAGCEFGVSIGLASGFSFFIPESISCTTLSALILAFELPPELPLPLLPAFDLVAVEGVALFGLMM